MLIAAAACEMHPAAVQAAASRPSLARALAQSTAQAAALGVREVPAVLVGERVFHGERGLEQAAAQMTAGPQQAAPAGAARR